MCRGNGLDAREGVINDAEWYTYSEERREGEAPLRTRKDRFGVPTKVKPAVN
jgi:hypothetical protein